MGLRRLLNDFGGLCSAGLCAMQGLNSTAAIALGSVLHLDNNTDLADATVTVNGNEHCSVNITELPAGVTGAAIESSATPQRMSSSYGQLLGVDGKFLRLVGVNYFGFDSSYPMLDGLWVSPFHLPYLLLSIVKRPCLPQAHFADAALQGSHLTCVDPLPYPAMISAAESDCHAGCRAMSIMQDH